jgi:hypothetical protein
MLLVPETYALVRGTAEFNAVAEELLREARLLHSLRHENIVQLRGVVMHPEHGHIQWLVTELADHGSLEKWVTSRSQMTLEELLDLLRSVMRALAYLHSRTPAVIHRDVKPANVLVFKSLGGGVVWKLADVGIAKVLQSTQHARTVSGTPMYMASDVLDGEYDGKVDVFSTGIMAAELVVRYVDIAGFERVDAAMYRDLKQRTALVEDACARLAVCPALSLVVRGCSARRARHRMSSDAALRALDEIDIMRDGGGGAGGGAVRPPAAPDGGPVVPATSAVPAAAPVTPPAVGAVQLIDMSDAADAVAALQVPADVLSRVCEAMTLVADDDAKVTGAQLLRIAVDEDMGAVAAMALRRRLSIAAPVPARRVRGRGAVMLLR